MKKLILIALIATFSFGKEYYGCKNIEDLENLKLMTEIGGMSLQKFNIEKDCIETTKKWNDTKEKNGHIQRCTNSGLCYWIVALVTKNPRLHHIPRFSVARFNLCDCHDWLTVN